MLQARKGDMPNHPSWNYQETIEKITSIKDTGVQEYAKIGYVLGARITELLTMKPQYISLNNGIIHATVNTLKTRKGKYIFRELLNIFEDEPFYCNALTKFYYKGFNSLNLQDYLHIGGKRSVELKLKSELGIVPHSLRHLRATHMGKNKIPSAIHQNNAPYLKRYFGWANIAMADIYIDKLTTQEIIEHYQKTKAVTPIPNPSYPIPHKPDDQTHG